MDGQNFQNNPFDQSGQSGQDGQNQGYPNQTTGSFYQDNTQYNQPVYSQPAAPVKAPTPALAIVSLVMGILSIVLGCCYGIGIIFGIAGIIMAVIANKQNKTGIGIAGLVCSIVGTVFSVIMLIYYIVVIGYYMSDPDFVENIMNNL